MNEIYIRYKHILSGCRTIYDALYFAQYIIKDYPESKKLINGMIHGKTYEKILDFRTMINTLNLLENMETKQDINDYINKNIKENYDFIQTNAMMRITKNKKIFINDKNNDTEEKIYKLNNDIENIINININTDNNQNNQDNLDNNLDNIDEKIILTNISNVDNPIENLEYIEFTSSDED